MLENYISIQDMIFLGILVGTFIKLYQFIKEDKIWN